jgi:hypothetical protein
VFLTRLAKLVTQSNLFTFRTIALRHGLGLLIIFSICSADSPTWE